MATLKKNKLWVLGAFVYALISIAFVATQPAQADGTGAFRREARRAGGAGGGGGDDLATVMAVGNTTGANDLEVTGTRTVRFAGNTSAFPAIRRSGTTDHIQVVRADGTVGAGLSVPNGTGSEQFGEAASATGAASTLLGANTTDGGNDSVVSIGTTTTPGGAGVVQIGDKAIGNAANSVAIGGPSGIFNVIAGAGCVSLGTNANTDTSTNSVAIGNAANTTASTGSFALGAGTTVTGHDNVIAIGNAATATADGGVALGTSASVGLNSFAMGNSATAGHSSSWVMGFSADSTAANQIVWGDFDTVFHYNHLKQYIQGNSETYERFGVTQELVTNSGTSVTTSGLVPAGARLIAITSRVNVEVTGATSLDFGDGTDQDLFAAGSALTVGTTTSMANLTAQPLTWYPSGLEVTVTSTAGTFTAGTVRISAVYETCAPPNK